MSETVNVTSEAVYKEVQKLIKEYKGPVEIGVSNLDGFINIYTDRGQAMHFHISDGEPYTWRQEWANLDDRSSAGYAKFIFDTMLNRSVRNGSKVNLPSRKKVLGAKQMPMLRKAYQGADDLAISRYIIYLAASGQTCKRCEVGIIEVEVGSYSEYHKCHNCGNMTTIK